MLLPSELKINVAEFLDPQSSINFGITCKEHWQLCQAIFKKHTQAFAEAPIVTAYNALDLLRATIQDPSQGWYIREISFKERWDLSTTPVEDADQLRQAARPLKSLYPHSSTNAGMEDLITQIDHGLATGRPDSVVGVLLHHLPNLRTLRVTMASRGNLFESLLERIGIEYVDDVKRASLPLQCLRTVSLAHHDTEGCVSPDWALPFLRLPSLRTFAASMMGGDFGRGQYEPSVSFHPHPQSGIEEFFFVGCQFDSAALEYLLSCTPALKRFTYDAGGCCVSDEPYDAKVVLKALAEHTQHSLECVILSHFMHNEEEVSIPDSQDEKPTDSVKASVRGFQDDAKERPTEADLSMFTNLKSLSANWAMLWPELSSQPAMFVSSDGCCSESIGLSCTPLDIRDVLPTSLENLHLGGVFNREEWEGVVGPLATLNEELPNLTMERIRVNGRVQSRVNYRDERQTIAIGGGGWDENEEKVTFGDADKDWIKRAWATNELFEGHGW